jgi:aminopeptidase N
LYDLKYNLYYDVNIEPDNFICSEVIYFRCLKSTNKLVLNMAADLSINNSTLKLTSQSDNSSFSEIGNFTWFYDVERQLFIAQFGEQVFEATKNYSLLIEFKAKLRSDTKTGLYKAYEDINKRWMIVMDSGRNDARKAFVCFDEPGLKAKFRLSITHNSVYDVISNMPVKAVEESNFTLNRKKTVFEDTPEMSTHLLGLVVSDIKCDSPSLRDEINNVSIQVCVRSLLIDRVEYLSGLVKSLMVFFQDYYTIKYVTSKISK